MSDSLDSDDVVVAKWTQPLLLGTQISAGVLVKKVQLQLGLFYCFVEVLVAQKGIFELVAHKYGSGFQSANESFVSKCSNFVHVGRFHRYWTRDSELRALIVTPQVASSHPEWAEVCRKGDGAHAGGDVLASNQRNMLFFSFF